MRRGYALCTRRHEIDDLIDQLYFGLGEGADRLLRFHDGEGAYQPSTSADWQAAPDGVDILKSQDLIRATFPSFAEGIETVIHIRRGGDIASQQLGQYMLEICRDLGVRRLTGEVKAIKAQSGFALEVQTADGLVSVEADRIVNAAGPFAGDLAAMLGVDLKLQNTFQQKIAFEDREGVIRRDMPFAIDLDPQFLDWEEEERAALAEEPEFKWLTEKMPGATHCRPDGGDHGKWIRIGWAYNVTPEAPRRNHPLDDQFPDISLRGATRLNPGLKTYLGKLPRNTHHYGGWYTMTEENWPLIGPMGVEGAFMNCALSGFGTMAACAGGELCAAWVAGGELPAYALDLSSERYKNDELMTTLRAANKGVL